MAENTQRNVFGLNGVAGMLIATALLISILVFLTVMAISTQQESAVKPYDPAPITGSLDNVKMISTDNSNFAFQDAKK